MALRPSERRAATLVAFLSVLFVGLVILSQRVSHGGVHAAIPDTSSPVGWAAVLGSIVTFGSYGIPIKNRDLQDAKVDPLVFQLFMSFGVTTCNMLVLTVTPFYFSWWGVLGALLWTGASTFSILAIRTVGIATAVALWGGVTIVVSFLWGAFIFHQPVSTVVGAVAAIAALVAGITAAASAQSSMPGRWAISLGLECLIDPDGADDAKLHAGSRHKRAAASYDSFDTSAPPSPFSDASSTADDVVAIVPLANDSLDDGAVAKRAAAAPEGDKEEEAAVVVTSGEEEEEEGVHSDATASPRILRGVMWAALVGLCNGSMMAPYAYYEASGETQRRVPSHLTALAYQTPFALGLQLVTPVLVALYAAARRLWGLPPLQLHVRVTAVPALITGAFWSAGNYCATVATAYLGNTVGFPLTQTCIMVTGLWGILFFREIQGRAAIALFGVAVVCILGGGALLVVSGSG